MVSDYTADMMQEPAAINWKQQRFVGTREWKQLLKSSLDLEPGEKTVQSRLASFFTSSPEGLQPDQLDEHTCGNSMTHVPEADSWKFITNRIGFGVAQG